MQKHNILVVFVSLFILTSCTKTVEEKEEEPRLIEVLETKTNIPISYAQIDFLNCSDFDAVFGCQSIQVVSTVQTDAMGNHLVNPQVLKKATKGFAIRKFNYWNKDGQLGKNYLTTEGSIKLHFIRQTNFPSPRVLLSVNVSGESGFVRINPFSIPADTTIQVKAFGNEVNKIGWEIGTSIQCILLCSIGPVLVKGETSRTLERFGTASIAIPY